MQFVPAVLISVAFAVLSARFGCEVFRRIALKIRLVDKPDAVRKLHGGAIPVGGGAVVFLSFFLASILAGLLNASLGAQMLTLLVSFATVGAFVVGFGLIDDKKGMNGLVKLFLQIVAASVVVVFAKDYSKLEFFGREFELGHLFYPLAIFWLVGVMNAFNFLDGADGVVATVGFFSFVAIGTLGVVNEYWGAATLAFLLAASLLGFFGCNRPPAQLYLGDAGSLFVGFSVGVLLLRVCSIRSTASLQVVPALCVALVPLADVFFAIVRRLNSGRSIFSPDRGHIHHRLQRRFGKGYPVLGALTMIQVPFCLTSVAGVYWRDDYVAALLASSLLLLFVTSGVLGRAETRILFYRTKYLVIKRFRRAKYDARGEFFHPLGTIRWVDLWRETLETAQSSACVSVYLDVDMPFANEDFYSEWNNLDWTRKARSTRNKLKFNIPLTVEGRFVGRLSLKFDAERVSFADAAAVVDRTRDRCLTFIEAALKEAAEKARKTALSNA